MFDLYNNTYTTNASYTYINAVILAANVGIAFWVNFFLYGKRRKNERQFQSEFKLYDALVIENTDRILNYFSAQEKLLTDFFSSGSMGLGSGHIRGQVEKICLNIENRYEAFENVECPVLSCFSSTLGIKVSEYCEKFSSKCLEIVTAVCSDSYDLDHLKSTLGQEKSRILSCVFEEIRSKRPE